MCSTTLMGGAFSRVAGREHARRSTQLTHDPACHALGVRRLRRVPIYVRQLVRGAHNTSWSRGHYPYAVCPASDSAASVSFAVLLIADHQYVEVIPQWAASTRDANARLCVVGRIGASDLPCEAARHEGCECLSHAPAIATSSTGRGVADSFTLHGSRARSVQYRFAYALMLLERNHSVLMLDADVFLRTGGMAKLLDFIQHGVGGHDFALMSNNERKEAYDDLNWGVAWMRPSRTSKHLLRCLLGEWDHHAFSDPRTGSYGRRSQPRVNHLIESSLMRGGGSSAAPRACTFPEKLAKRALKHMTGYPSVKHKLACARVMGLHQPARKSWGRPQLRYRVPIDASSWHQRNALLAAAQLARSTNRTLVLPRAVFQGKTVGFCELFDIAAMNLTCTDCFLSKTEAISSGGKCHVSIAAFPANWAAGGTAMMKLQSTPVVCLPFESLAVQTAPPQPAYICDPRRKAVRRHHVCSTTLVAPRVPHLHSAAGPNGSWQADGVYDIHLAVP